VNVDFNTMMTDEQERVRIHPSEVREWFRPELRVRLADTNLEVEAVLERGERQAWLARPDWSTRRDLPYP
jgi:hypothetical protein